MEYEEQEFHDFYYKLEWGISKDLLAIESIFIEYEVTPERAKADLQKSTKLSYFVVGDDFNFNDIFKVKLDREILFYPIRGYQKMLWLGRIKQAAAKKVDSTFPYYTEIIE